MAFVVALVYPNGRTHETDLDPGETPRLGWVFELYGRTWRVNEVIDDRYSRRVRRIDAADESTRYVCVCVT